MRLATLTHDMERAFGGPDAIPIKMSDRAYEEAHSNRSARIVGEWLRANGADDELAAQVEELIRVHEWGGSPDANLVQAADSLSFLETNIDLMLGFVKNGQIFPRPTSRSNSTRCTSASSCRQPENSRGRCGSRRRHAWRRCEAVSSIARPESLDELLALMRAHGASARLLAGGTDLWCACRKALRVVPPVVIDLKRVAALRDGHHRRSTAASASARAR